MQKKKTTAMTSAAITGLMVGTAMGMMVKGMMTPKRKKMTKKASKALDVVGEVMQNVSSFLG